MEKTNFYVEKINEKFNTRFICDQDINWDYISSMVRDWEDLMAYSNYLNWDIVSMSGEIWWILSYSDSCGNGSNIRYLSYFKDKINWDLFFKYTEAPLEEVVYVDPSFFEEYVNWNVVFKYQRDICSDSDDFRRNLLNVAGEKADWKIISRYQNLGDKFIINNIKKLDLELVLKYQILSVDVISKLKSLGLIGDKEIKIILQNQPFFEISDKEISKLLKIKEKDVIEGMKNNALRHAELIGEGKSNGELLIIRNLFLDYDDRVPSHDDLLGINGDKKRSKGDSKTKLFFTIGDENKEYKIAPDLAYVHELLTTETIYPIED